MTRTIKLTGKALDLARSLKASTDDTRAELDLLNAEAQTTLEAGRARALQLQQQLSDALGLEPGACCHVDFSYLEEHGDAYVTTGCGADNLMAAADVKAGGGLH